MEKEQVNHPAHYNRGNIECIDAMLSSKGVFKTLAFCECDVFKYNWRQGQKDDVIQDISKQTWYNNAQVNLLNKIREIPEAQELYDMIVAMSNKLDTLIKL